MRSISDTSKLLLKSLFSNDVLILIFGIFTLFMFILTLWGKNNIKKRRGEWNEEKNSAFSRFLMKSTKTFYTIFTTSITIFPLLGMLGTVFGLLGLDLANGDMENIKNNPNFPITFSVYSSKM